MKTKGGLRPRDIDLAKGAEKTCRKEKRCLSKDFSDGGADSVMEAVSRPSMLRIQHTQRVTRIPQELLREQADVCGTAILMYVEVTHGVCWLAHTGSPSTQGQRQEDCEFDHKLSIVLGSPGLQ